MTNRYDLYVIEQIQHLLEVKTSNIDVFVLFNTDGKLPVQMKPFKKIVFPFTSEIIYEMGYMPLGDSLVMGNCHFPVLRFYLEHNNYDYYWVIEDDVLFSGKWSKLFEFYNNDCTDLLSSYIKTPSDIPHWPWWKTLYTADEQVDRRNVICAFNPVYRLSHRALNVIHSSLQKGWKGHAEVVISSILKHNGMSVKDIGGTGSFTPECDKNRFYKSETYSYASLKIQDIIPDTIYHPIKRKKGVIKLRHNCVISAVGKNSLHKQWIDGLQERDFDLHLIVYDDSFSRFYSDADFVSSKKGYKLRLVYDYLVSNPEYLNHYEYFFIPDDDIFTDGETIEELFVLMKKYGLKIAQPALKNSYFTYPITLQDPFCELRYTDFVEMMIPCFSQQAIKKVLATFNANESGWGVEFHWRKLIGTNGHDMAIIDKTPMIHTQPVQQGRDNNHEEMRTYLKQNNLSQSVSEVGCVPLLENNDFSQLRQNKAVLIDNLIKMAKILWSKMNDKEIIRHGLDGITGIGLFFCELGKLSNAQQFTDYSKRILSEVNVDNSSIPLSVNSFIEEDFGKVWAYQRCESYLQLRTSKYDEKMLKKKDICSFEDTIGIKYEDLNRLNISVIMYKVMEYMITKHKSDISQLLLLCWKYILQIEYVYYMLDKKRFSFISE